jgi:hypothetical protein
MRRMIFVSAGLAVFAVLVFGQMTFAADMLSGNWKLNLTKSKYSPANLAPKSGMTKFELTQDGVKTVTDGVDSQGRKTHSDYTAKFDGKEVPWKGTIDAAPSPDQDAVAWKKVDDYTYELTNRLKGQVLTSQRTVISRDGKSRTNTLTGKNAQGQTISNTVVYDKQ